MSIIVLNNNNINSGLHTLGLTNNIYTYIYIYMYIYRNVHLLSFTNLNVDSPVNSLL